MDKKNDIRIDFHELNLQSNDGKYLSLLDFITKEYKILDPDDIYPRGQLINRKNEYLTLIIKSKSKDKLPLKFLFRRILRKKPKATKGSNARPIKLKSGEKGYAEDTYLIIYPKNKSYRHIIVSIFDHNGPRISLLEKYIHEISNEQYNASIKPFFRENIAEELKVLGGLSKIELKLDLQENYPKQLETINSINPLKKIHKKLNSKITSKKTPDRKVNPRHSITLTISSSNNLFGSEIIDELVNMVDMGFDPAISQFKVSKYGMKRDINLLTAKMSYNIKINKKYSDMTDQQKFSKIETSYQKHENILNRV